MLLCASASWSNDQVENVLESTKECNVVVAVVIFVVFFCCFFFNDTATTEIYTLSLHDALPISKQFGKSLMNIRKSRGPRVEPCGTPQFTGKL